MVASKIFVNRHVDRCHCAHHKRQLRFIFRATRNNEFLQFLLTLLHFVTKIREQFRCKEACVAYVRRQCIGFGYLKSVFFNQFCALRKNTMAAMWSHLHLVQIENPFDQRTLVWVRINSVEYTDAEFVVFLQTESADFREISLVQRNVVSIHYARNHLLHNWASHNFYEKLLISFAHTHTNQGIRVQMASVLRRTNVFFVFDCNFVRNSLQSLASALFTPFRFPKQRRVVFIESVIP